MTTIVPGSTAQTLSVEIARELDCSLSVPTFDRFPDGETIAAVPDFDDDRAIVVASTTSNDAHVELLQLADAVREAGATDVTVVLGYMGYARQDKAFKPGQPVSARAVARAIGTLADRIVVVDPHEEGVLEFFGAPAESTSAADRLALALPEGLESPLFVAPDEGAIDLARQVRDGYGAGEADYFEKERDYDTGEIEVTPSDASVEGRDVVVVDDIIATGSTMSDAIEVLVDRDAACVFAACVHPMLVGNAYSKLSRAGAERIVGTDTIERAVTEVSAAPAIVDVL